MFRIPANYLPGTQDQLQPSQLKFIVKRVERFMRELDIPGLSIAISRDEQLKFAAGKPVTLTSFKQRPKKLMLKATATPM
jgi:hypothetical protein